MNDDATPKFNTSNTDEAAALKERLAGMLIVALAEGDRVKARRIVHLLDLVVNCGWVPCPTCLERLLAWRR